MNTNQSLNSRGSHIAWVDFLRILACFLVVLAHCCDPFVGSFDGSFNFKSAVFWGSLVRPCVPLFVMISGVLLFPVTLEMGAFYSRRLKRVLVPLIVWSLVLPLLYFGYFAAGVQTASPNIVMDTYTWSATLERVEREKMTADEIQNAYGKYGGQYMKMGGSILEKYRLENCSVQFSLYLMRETEGLDDKERLKALYRIRKDILSGKLKVPGEGGGMGESGLEE